MSTTSTSATSNFPKYSDYMAGITASPKSGRKLPSSSTGGIGQHINPLHNQFPNQSQQAAQQQGGGMPTYGGATDKCARCSKAVYLAEKKVGAGRCFHSRCFSCRTCNRKLDATTLSEHKGEIFCKPCYTKAWGMHGLVSGVTMSTEHIDQQHRPTRRSSYGADLEAPVNPPSIQNSRQRSHSNENLLRGELGDDQANKIFPWRDAVLPSTIGRQDSASTIPKSGGGGGGAPVTPTASNTPTNGLDAMIRYHQDHADGGNKPVIGFDKILPSVGGAAAAASGGRHTSTYFGEEDRNQYMFEGEKKPYGGSSGVHQFVETTMPVVPPVRFDHRYSSQSNASSTGGIGDIARNSPVVHQMPSPTISRRKFTDEEEARSRSPSPVRSNDAYQRSNSRERQVDITDNFSRMTLVDPVTVRSPQSAFSTQQSPSRLASQNPIGGGLLEQAATTKTNFDDNNYYRTSSSTYETRTTTATATTNLDHLRDQQHSRDSSPSSTSGGTHAQYNRSPSPTSGYVSSHTTSSSTYGGVNPLLRDSQSPSAFVPQSNSPPAAHDYLNVTPSPSRPVADRQSSYSTNQNPVPSAIGNFMETTKNLGVSSSVGGGAGDARMKNSTLAALIRPPRRDSDDEFED